PLVRRAPPLDGRVSRRSARLRDLAPDRTAMLRNVTDLDLRLLRIFACVVKCGGFTAAQAELNMSQSNISMHIASLEKRLGYRLCERGTGGFRL
ncbi:LysR family transcriptional regulator, partial [Listeria monocytogenes]|nr:LysR family transcriptional regulator [Listeria monocytogenes]